MGDIIIFLKQSDIFYQFTQTQLELVANLSTEKIFHAGETIFAHERQAPLYAELARCALRAS